MEVEVVAVTEVWNVEDDVVVPIGTVDTPGLLADCVLAVPDVGTGTGTTPGAVLG